MKVSFETERLLIRDPLIDDFDVIWQMRNDEAVTKFTGGITKMTREQAYEWHLKQCEDRDNTPKEYAVVLKEGNVYIGYCGFQYCNILGNIELLYGISKEYWGNGYGAEAAKAVLDFGVHTLEYDSISAAVNYDNVASDKILLKIGMTYIGDVEWPEQGMVKHYQIKAI